MKFTISREEVFVPTWKNNDKDEEPIRFLLKHLTIIEREGLLNFTYDEDGKVRFKPDNLKAVRFGVKKIENLIVDGKSIETAAEFLTLPADFHDLLMEVGSKIITMHAIKDEGAEKNS